MMSITDRVRAGRGVDFVDDALRLVVLNDGQRLLVVGDDAFSQAFFVVVASIAFALKAARCADFERRA